MRYFVKMFSLLSFLALLSAHSVAAETSATTTAAPKQDARSEAPPRVEFQNSKGSFVIELYKDKAPISVANFLEYVEAGYYDNTIFHRVIPNFMVQGGGFTTDMAQKQTRAPIRNESSNGLKNRRGTLAMARTARPDSATSQFFINTVDNAYLDGRPGAPGYAVFGKIVEGMEVIDQMSQVRTGNSRGHSDVPVEPIIVKKAQLQQ